MKLGTPVRSEKGGTGPARSALKNFGRAPSRFGPKSTISRFGERFRDGQYSLVSFLFAVLLLTVAPCPVIYKSGGHVPPCPMESAPLFVIRESRLPTECRPNSRPYKSPRNYFPFAQIFISCSAT